MYKLLSPLLMGVALVMVVQKSSAQSASDSLEIAQRITTAYPGHSFAESARMLLLNYFEADAVGRAGSLVQFMDRRGGAAWLAPSERLMTSLLTAAFDLLGDRQQMSYLLAGSVDPAFRSTHSDRMIDRLRPMLRSATGRIMAGFDQAEPPEEERRFLELVVNHLLVVGYRARAELNDRVDRFSSDFPGSWRSELAELYIRRPYDEADVGAAFSAGYSTGFFSGALGGRFDSPYGPVLGGEVYVYRATVAGMLGFGVAPTSGAFRAAGRSWETGEAPMTVASIGAGYEIRFERLGITPIVGYSVLSIRGAGEEVVDGAQLPRTGYRSGLDLGIIVGWRIPFDVGPSIDLRLRLDRIAPSLDEYDPAFAGEHYMLQLGFALVQRPYRTNVR